MRKKRDLLIVLTVSCALALGSGALSAAAEEDCTETGNHTAGTRKYMTDYTECLGGYEKDFYECIFCGNAVDAEGKEVQWNDGTGVHTAGSVKYVSDYTACQGGFAEDYYLCEACGYPVNASGEEVLYEEGTGRHTAGSVSYKATYTACSGGIAEDYYMCSDCGCPVNAEGEELEYRSGTGTHRVGSEKNKATYTECLGGFTEDYYVCEDCFAIVNAEGIELEYKAGTDIHTAGTEKKQANYSVCLGGIEEDYYECTGCGYPVDAAGNELYYKIGNGKHSVEKVERKEPTYEAEGYEAHWRCEYCSGLFEDEKASISIDDWSEIVLPQLRDETADVILPAVGGLKASASGMNRVTVSWNAVNGADGYLVLRGGVQVGFTMGSTSYVDSTADSRNFNYYWVMPFYKNDAGKNVKGTLSNYVWAIGRVIGQTKNLSAGSGKNGIALTWNRTDNANGYVILSKTGSSTAPFNEPVKVTGNSYTDTSASGVTFYWVYATYANAAGVVAAGAVSPFAWAVAK